MESMGIYYVVNIVNSEGLINKHCFQDVDDAFEFFKKNIVLYGSNLVSLDVEEIMLNIK